MSKYPAVGLAVLSWNCKRYLEKFLPPLLNITYPNYTIYVIDNGSTDDSMEFVRSHFPSVKIITIPKNQGVAGGYNYGFAHIAEEYVAMLNSDVEVTPGFLEPLVEAIQTDDTIAICQSKILSYADKTKYEYGGAAGGMIDWLGYTFCRGRIFNVMEPDTNQYPSSDIFWAGGACCLVRRSIYNAIGGMYEHYQMHFEEIDLCWRMHTHNYRIIYCNQSVAYHVGGGTLSYQSSRKTYYNFRNNLIMCIRNSPALFLIWWIPLRFLLDQVVAVKFLVQGEFHNTWAIIKAYFSLIRWLLAVRNKFPPATKSLLQIPIVFKKSIVWLFFVKKKRTYASLNHS